MRNFCLKSIEELIEQYVHEFGGEMYQLEEGGVGLGLVVLTGAEGKKSVIIREHYLNEWSSCHDLKVYRKLPKKYQSIIDKL